MVVDVAGVLETISSTGDLRDDNATKKIRMDKATKGNNVEYILDGAKVPLKKEMQPHTVYVYKDAEGDIYLTSKKNKTPEKLGKDSNSKAIEKDAQERFNTQGKHSKTPNSNIEEHRKAATEAANNRIDAIKNRLSDINHAEQNPLGTKERDLADLRAITAAAVEKGLIAQTYRQSRAAMIEGVASGAVKIANAVAKGTPEPVKRSIRETAALVSVPVNMAIGVVFGGEKAPGFDKATTIGSAADKVANRAQATWEAMKTSEFTALRQPVKALDIAANAVHTAVNSKALGRTVGVVIAAATVTIPGVGWAAGGVMAAQTIAGVRSEIEREGIDIKKRQLVDLVAASHQKQEMLNTMGIKPDQAKALGLSSSELREAPKPTSMNYRATGTSWSAELKTLASVSTNAVSMGIDAITGNAPALVLKTSVAVSGAATGLSSQVDEDHAKSKLNAEIKKLEAIAPEFKDKISLGERSRTALIEAKALELASKDPNFKTALEGKNTDAIKKAFEPVKLAAAKECEKEWHIEADARGRANNDPQFRKAVEEARGKGPHSLEVKELGEKFEQHQKAAEASYDKPKTSFISRIKAAIKPTNIYHNNSNIIVKATASIGQNTSKELFAERTKYSDITVKNTLAKNAEYMAKHDIVDKQSFGGASRVAERTKDREQIQAKTKEQLQVKVEAQAKTKNIAAPTPAPTKTISEHTYNFAMQIQEKLTKLTGIGKNASYTQVPHAEKTKQQEQGNGGRGGR